MYKFHGQVAYGLHEADQSNPLRWELLYRESEDTFRIQTAKFKCRDYLNDIVAKYHGTDFVIYGMDTKVFQLNDEGVYLRLTDITNRDILIENIDQCVNQTELIGVERVVIEPIQDTPDALLFIPRWFFNHTYRISLLSYIIRVSSLGEKFGSFDDIWKSAAHKSDAAISTNYAKTICKWKFNVPQSFRDYWFYAGQAYNSSKKVESFWASVVHNNGVVNWIAYTGEKV